MSEVSPIEVSSTTLPLQLRAGLGQLDPDALHQLVALKEQAQVAAATLPTRTTLERELAVVRGKLLQVEREQGAIREELAACWTRVQQWQAAAQALELEISALESGASV